MKNTVFIFIFCSLFLFKLEVSLAQQSCSQLYQSAKTHCDLEKLKEYESALAAYKVEGTAPAIASESHKEVTAAKADLDAKLESCKGLPVQCEDTCKKEAIIKLSKGQSAESEQKMGGHCGSGFKEVERKAIATSANMGETLKALMGILQMVGMGGGGAELPLCSREPQNPECTTDVASKESSDFSNGKFRNGESGLIEGDLGGEGDVSGGAAGPTNTASGGGAGAGGLGGAFGAGGSGNVKGKEPVAKGEAFDGAPKINVAGSTGTASPGGGNSSGGARSASGKNSGNPLASRTSLDSPDNNSAASKLAQAAEQRLRGPASNEPIGGVTSVYYLDNFTKIEKRMTNERNSLKEH